MICQTSPNLNQQTLLANVITRETLRYSAVFAVIVCLSVRPSVASRSSMKTTKQMITQTTLRELYEAKDLCEISIGSPPSVAPNSGRVGKNCVVRPVEESPAQSLYRQLTTTTLVVVKLCLSHVAYTAHFSITCM